jgi:WD40 repeat protein/transcriptional regulator with XRE-family HTH domain/predicted transcriptional regulator
MGRSLKVAPDQFTTVRSSLVRKGFATQQALADNVGISRDTINKFLNGKKISAANFMDLCEVLGLDIEKISVDESKAPSNTTGHRPTKSPIQDWNGAPSIKYFYGRQQELGELKRGIVDDKCRVLFLSGLGGIGKTSLATKLAHEIQNDFQVVIWRSLRKAPLCLDLRLDLFKVFAKGKCSDFLEQKNSDLIDHLKNNRCLIILTNFEAVMQDGDGVGKFRPNYEEYDELLRSLSEQSHKSCVILTSSEIPKNLVSCAGPELPVRIHETRGLDLEASRRVIHSKGISGPTNFENELINKYQGHPKALQLISNSIKHIFLGDIQRFLASGETFVFNGLRQFLSDRFKRLSHLEISIMNWLAINQEPMSESKLSKDINTISKTSLRESLQALARRSFIESKKEGFILQYFIYDYILNKLVEDFFEDIEIQKINKLNLYPLIKSDAQESVRRAQSCLILEPLSKRLVDSYGVPGTKTRLGALIQQLKSSEFERMGYAAGNIFNLLTAIQKIELPQEKPVLSNYDFSGLPLWQADLRGIVLDNVNLSYTDLSKAVFYNAHSGILSVALSQDGKWIVMGDASHKAYIWKLEKGGTCKPYLTLTGHTHWVRAVAISPDGQHVATGSEDGTVRLWELETGNGVAVLKGYRSRIRSLAFHPNGLYLASGSDDSTIVVWHLETRKRFETWQTPDQRIRSVVFSPDGRFVVAASHPGNVYLLDLQRNEKTSFSTGRDIRVIAIHPTQSILAVGSDAGKLSLWSLENHNLITELEVHKNWIRMIAFSSDGKFLATGSEDTTIGLLDFENNLSCSKILQGHTSRVWSLAFNTDNTFLVSVSDDQSLKFWNIKTGNCLTTFQGYTCKVRSVVYGFCDQFIAAGSDDHFARIWNVRTGQEYKIFRGHKGRIWSVFFISNGERLVSAGDDQKIRIWDTNTEACIETFSPHNTWIRSVSVSPDGQLMASVGDDKVLRLCALNTGEWTVLKPGHQDWILSVCFSPDGKWIATGSDDKTVKIWDVLTKQLIQTFEHDGWVRAVSFSYCSRYLVSGCNDGNVRIWDLKTASCSQKLQGHKGWVRTVAFHPSQNILASGGYDQTIILWDASTGQQIRVLKGHQEAVISINFNSTGTTLVSGSEDETIKQWDIESGECISTFRVPRPYEKTNFTGATGLSKSQRDTLKGLGAVEELL